MSKKSGITEVKNDAIELIPTRIQTGWQVCIDYRKLNMKMRTRSIHWPDVGTASRTWVLLFSWCILRL